MKSSENKVCIGTGLVALDVILNGKPETPPKLFTGGSCGNVLAILAYMGWASFPIARLAKNNATKEIENDLKKWEVNTSLISKTIDGSTPIIIHRILKDKLGQPKHKFEFKDPDTSVWLPSYKPILKKDVPLISEHQPIANVFYFDRYNRGAIELAKANKKQGAIIFFEPSSISDEKLFEECLAISDIVKFSNDRIPNYSELYPFSKALLEIETLGAEGLRYRYSPNRINKSWKKVKAYKSNRVQDAAGAGDWCSAGIIHSLFMSSSHPLNTANKTLVEYSLKCGQILGALNCSFDGARGIMYEVDKKEFEKILSNLVKETDPNLEEVNFSKLSSPTQRKPIKISSLY